MSELIQEPGRLRLKGDATVLIDLNAGDPGVTNLGILPGEGEWSLNDQRQGDPTHEIEIPGSPLRLRLVPEPFGTDDYRLFLQAGALSIDVEMGGAVARQLLKALKPKR